MVNFLKEHEVISHSIHLTLIRWKAKNTMIKTAPSHTMNVYLNDI